MTQWTARVGPSSTITSGRPAVGRPLIERIAAAYKLSMDEFSGPGDSMWAAIVQKKSDIHSALIERDFERLAAIFEDPGKTDFFYGFDDLYSEATKKTINHGRDDNTWPQIAACLVDLMEAIGAVTLWNPESRFHKRIEIAAPAQLASAIGLLEKFLGFTLHFPNPFPGEVGAGTIRGVCSWRAPQALYQAWRVAELSRKFGKTVVEIGGGLGRTAFYARPFGIGDYTIIDLPLTCAAQALFLGLVLGPDAISLAGEHETAAQIKIRPPSYLMNGGKQFDIALNADSMTEMDESFAGAYAATVAVKTKAFLSINHEINTFCVSDLPALAKARVYRCPYWMRKGYAEELYVFRGW